MKIRLFPTLAAAACGLVILPFAGGALRIAQAQAASPAQALPAPKIDAAPPSPGKMETAVLAGGCFWGVQGVFEHVKGVKKV